jgi:hypothetical protein
MWSFGKATTRPFHDWRERLEEAVGAAGRTHTQLSSEKNHLEQEIIAVAARREPQAVKHNLEKRGDGDTAHSEFRKSLRRGLDVLSETAIRLESAA